jgi:hypothetical protein
MTYELCMVKILGQHDYPSLELQQTRIVGEWIYNCDKRRKCLRVYAPLKCMCLSIYALDLNAR